MMQNKWTYNETLIAFNAYCKIPFKNSNKNHPLVIEYSKLIGRSPSAVNMKIGNIGRLDPSLLEKGIVGLSHGAKLEQDIWNEFTDNPEKLIIKSELLIEYLNNKKSAIIDNGSMDSDNNETQRMALIQQRVGQSFFRTTVLNSYNNTCCISGVREPNLLEACHITDWSSDIKNRTNPSNGICLNVFFHKAFDCYLMGITPDYNVEVSEQLIQSTTTDDFRRYLLSLDGIKINMPDKFLPDKNLLAIHYDEYRKSM